MPTNAGHPTDEVLERYSLGQLPDPQSLPLEEHLLTCKSCQDRLEQTDEYVAAMRTALAELETESAPVEAKESPARRWLPRFPMPAWAGALAAAALIALVLPWNTGPQQPFELSLETHRGAAVAQNPSAPAGRPLRLTLDITGLPGNSTLTAVIVSAAGETLRQGTLERTSEAATLNVTEPLDAGHYWLRVYGTSAPEELLREFSLRVQ